MVICTLNIAAVHLFVGGANCQEIISSLIIEICFTFLLTSAKAFSFVFIKLKHFQYQVKSELKVFFSVSFQVQSIPDIPLQC